MKKLFERIVCAAVQYPDGSMLVGPRHFDNIMLQQYRKLGLQYEEDVAISGFLDQDGNFLNRQEAWVIAMEKGQVRHRTSGDTREGGTLFSENLY